MALEIGGISTRAKLVLIGLANCASDETFECFPGRKHLAKVGDCSVDTVDRALKELAENHLIEVNHQWLDDKERVPTANSYRLFPWFDPSRKNAATPAHVAAQVRPGVTAELRPPSRTDAPTLAARDAATNEPSKEPSGSVVQVPVSKATIDWLVDRLGDKADTISGHLRSGHILNALLRAGCDWAEDIVQAADHLALTWKSREPIRSWKPIEEHALRLRDYRLAGLPPPQAPQPLKTNGASNGRGTSSLPSDDDWARAAAAVARNATT